MRVLCYPADSSRCGRRIIWPAETLIEQGADITIADRHQPDDPVWQQRADVVVLQRPMLRRYVEPHWDDENQKWNPLGVIQILQADGMKVVVDIDDDFTALHHKNAVWERTHPAETPDCNWHHLSAACRLADLVTVTTPALAKVYGRYGRVVVIPNHIPASYLEIERPKNDVPVVGWAGAVKIHPHDLQETRGGVARAVQCTGAEFWLVGPPNHVQEHLWLKAPPTLIQERLGLPMQMEFAGIDDDGNEILKPSPGWVDLEDYGLAAAQLDIGIVPLKDSAFNRAKSWLKMMEFAALGVVPIGSPTPPNVEFAERYGLPLAKKPQDWERWVRRLVTDDSLRVEMSQSGRDAMKAETIEANAHIWQEVWEMAYNGGRKMVSV